MCIFIIIRYTNTVQTRAQVSHDATNNVLRLFNILCSFIFNTFNNSNNNEYWNDFPVFIMIKMCVCEIFIGEIFFFSTTTTDAIRSIHRKTFTYSKKSKQTLPQWKHGLVQTILLKGFIRHTQVCDIFLYVIWKISWMCTFTHICHVEWVKNIL